MWGKPQRPFPGKPARSHLLGVSLSLLPLSTPSVREPGLQGTAGNSSLESVQLGCVGGSPRAGAVLSGGRRREEFVKTEAGEPSSQLW